MVGPPGNNNVPNSALQRSSTRLLAIAWGLVALGALALLLGYASLPDAVVLVRPPWADAPATGPKSFLTVSRIAWMGAGQLGAATAMALGTRGSERWERFWRWLGLTAGGKTALECATLVTPKRLGLDPIFTLLTIAVVATFVVMAARWWRRGELREHPRLTGASRYWLLASLCLWAAFAVAPLKLWR